MEYGTGAVMAVPAHDQRDFEFARQYGLPVRPVIQPEGEELDGGTMAEAYEGEGRMVRSGHFDGSITPGSIGEVVAWLKEEGLGTGVVRYRLRDWNVARQRFWGCPIPMIRCPKDGDVPVPEEDLPVVLPELEDYTPTGTGESPLAKVEEWVNVACPRCAGPARRETETLDTFIDSSWYFFRYAGPSDKQAFDSDAVGRWMPVDQYCGGIEHATGHLLYSRFFTKVLHDIGLVPFTEPYPNLLNQGQVIMEGAAMSKSRGNLVAPKEIVDEFGADTARTTMLFAGPFEADVDWADVSAQGVFRWLSRVWRITVENAERIARGSAPAGGSDLRKSTHQTIAGVTEDLERFKFNTAIAKLMSLTNDLQKLQSGSSDEDVAEAIESLLKMLAPTAPFITEELWHRLGREGSIHKASWPSVDEALTAVDTVPMAVQVNGKTRDVLEVATEVEGARMEEVARASDKVAKHLDGKQVVKVITVPPKLINFVVR
jgi:leucyl-tRNA synthetase